MDEMVPWLKFSGRGPRLSLRWVSALPKGEVGFPPPPPPPHVLLQA